MRGRHSAAILRMMDVTETIAETVNEYVSIAVRLAIDLTWRAEIRSRIASNKYKIFGDTVSVSALERFFDAAVRAEGERSDSG